MCGDIRKQQGIHFTVFKVYSTTYFSKIIFISSFDSKSIAAVGLHVKSTSANNNTIDSRVGAIYDLMLFCTLFTTPGLYVNPSKQLLIFCITNEVIV